MYTQKIKFAAGMQVIKFNDSLERETEVCVGHRDIIVTHKNDDGSTESMRRYSRNDISTLFEILNGAI